MKFCKLTAFLTILVFAVTNTAWGQITNPIGAAPGSSSAELQLDRIRIPSELGRIESYRRSPGQAPLIVFVQDAHAILDAQSNIRKIIRYLKGRYGMDLVAVEGGEGPFDVTLFRTFPDEKIKKKVFTQYLQRAELSAPEMAAILDEEGIDYHGIENWRLYEKNYLAWLAAMGERDEILEKLKSLKSQFDQEREALYTQKLNTFHKHVEAFEGGETHLLELLKYLSVIAASSDTLPRNDVDLSPYPHLADLFSYLEKESALPREGVEISVRRLAASFAGEYESKLARSAAMEFNAAHQSFLAGQTDAGAFLKTLITVSRTLGLKPKLTPAMREVIGHSEMLSSIRGTRLFDELQAFLREMEERLITKPEEKELAQKYRSLRLLEDLANLELTREQWEEIKAYGVERIADRETDEPLYALRPMLFAHLEFYRLALERDRVFHKNLQSLLRRKKKRAVIFVAGGFHTRGFEKGAAGEPYSLLVVAPKMNSLAGKELYAGVMQGKISYKSFVKTTFYDAFARHASLNLVNGLHQADFRKDFKLWRDEVIRRLAGEGRVAEAGEYTRYLDLLLKTYLEKFGGEHVSVTKEQILGAVEKEIERFTDETVNHLWQRFQVKFKAFTRGLEALRQKDGMNRENVSALLDQVNRAHPSSFKQFVAAASVIRKNPPLSAAYNFFVTGQAPVPADVPEPFDVGPAFPFAGSEEIVSAILGTTKGQPAPPSAMVDVVARTSPAVQQFVLQLTSTDLLKANLAPEVRTPPGPVTSSVAGELLEKVTKKVRAEIRTLPITEGIVAHAIAQAAAEPASRAEVRERGKISGGNAARVGALANQGKSESRRKPESPPSPNRPTDLFGLPPNTSSTLTFQNENQKQTDGNDHTAGHDGNQSLAAEYPGSQGDGNQGQQGLIEIFTPLRSESEHNRWENKQGIQGSQQKISYSSNKSARAEVRAFNWQSAPESVQRFHQFYESFLKSAEKQEASEFVRSFLKLEKMTLEEARDIYFGTGKEPGILKTASGGKYVKEDEYKDKSPVFFLIDNDVFADIANNLPFFSYVEFIQKNPDLLKQEQLKETATLLGKQIFALHLLKEQSPETLENLFRAEARRTMVQRSKVREGERRRIKEKNEILALLKSERETLQGLSIREAYKKLKRLEESQGDFEIGIGERTFYRYLAGYSDDELRKQFGIERGARAKKELPGESEAGELDSELEEGDPDTPLAEEGTEPEPPRPPEEVPRPKYRLVFNRGQVRALTGVSDEELGVKGLPALRALLEKGPVAISGQKMANGFTVMKKWFTEKGIAPGTSIYVDINKEDGTLRVRARLHKPSPAASQKSEAALDELKAAIRAASGLEESKGSIKDHLETMFGLQRNDLPARLELNIVPFEDKSGIRGGKEIKVKVVSRKKDQTSGTFTTVYNLTANVLRGKEGETPRPMTLRIVVRRGPDENNVNDFVSIDNEMAESPELQIKGKVHSFSYGAAEAGQSTYRAVKIYPLRRSDSKAAGEESPEDIDLTPGGRENDDNLDYIWDELMQEASDLTHIWDNLEKGSGRKKKAGNTSAPARAEVRESDDPEEEVGLERRPENVDSSSQDTPPPSKRETHPGINLSFTPRESAKLRTLLISNLPDHQMTPQEISRYQRLMAILMKDLSDPKNQKELALFPKVLKIAMDSFKSPEARRTILRTFLLYPPSHKSGNFRRILKNLESLRQAAKSDKYTHALWHEAVSDALLEGHASDSSSPNYAEDARRILRYLQGKVRVKITDPSGKVVIRTARLKNKERIRSIRSAVLNKLSGPPQFLREIRNQLDEAAKQKAAPPTKPETAKELKPAPPAGKGEGKWRNFFGQFMPRTRTEWVGMGGVLIALAALSLFFISGPLTGLLTLIGGAALAVIPLAVSELLKSTSAQGKWAVGMLVVSLMGTAAFFMGWFGAWLWAAVSGISMGLGLILALREGMTIAPSTSAPGQERVFARPKARATAGMAYTSAALAATGLLPFFAGAIPMGLVILAAGSVLSLASAVASSYFESKAFSERIQRDTDSSEPPSPLPRAEVRAKSEKEIWVDLEQTFMHLEKEAELPAGHAEATVDPQERPLGIFQSSFFPDIKEAFDSIYLNPEDTLLDLGGGTGRVSVYAALRYGVKRAEAYEGSKKLFEASQNILAALKKSPPQRVDAGRLDHVKIQMGDFFDILKDPEALKQFSVIYYFALGSHQASRIPYFLGKNMREDAVFVLFDQYHDPKNPSLFPDLKEISQEFPAGVRIRIFIHPDADPARIKSLRLSRAEVRSEKVSVLTPQGEEKEWGDSVAQQGFFDREFDVKEGKAEIGAPVLLPLLEDFLRKRSGEPIQVTYLRPERMEGDDRDLLAIERWVPESSLIEIGKDREKQVRKIIQEIDWMLHDLNWREAVLQSEWLEMGGSPIRFRWVLIQKPGAPLEVRLDPVLLHPDLDETGNLDRQLNAVSRFSGIDVETLKEWLRRGRFGEFEKAIEASYQKRSAGELMEDSLELRDLGRLHRDLKVLYDPARVKRKEEPLPPASAAGIDDPSRAEVRRSPAAATGVESSEVPARAETRATPSPEDLQAERKFLESFITAFNHLDMSQAEDVILVRYFQDLLEELIRDVPVVTDTGGHPRDTDLLTHDAEKALTDREAFVALQALFGLRDEESGQVVAYPDIVRYFAGLRDIYVLKEELDHGRLVIHDSLRLWLNRALTVAFRDLRRRQPNIRQRGFYNIERIALMGFSEVVKRRLKELRKRWKQAQKTNQIIGYYARSAFYSSLVDMTSVLLKHIRIIERDTGRLPRAEVRKAQTGGGDIFGSPFLNRKDVGGILADLQRNGNDPSLAVEKWNLSANTKRTVFLDRITGNLKEAIAGPARQAADGTEAASIIVGNISDLETLSNALGNDGFWVSLGQFSSRVISVVTGLFLPEAEAFALPVSAAQEGWAGAQSMLNRITGITQKSLVEFEMPELAAGPERLGLWQGLMETVAKTVLLNGLLSVRIRAGGDEKKELERMLNRWVDNQLGREAIRKHINARVEIVDRKTFEPRLSGPVALVVTPEASPAKLIQTGAGSAFDMANYADGRSKIFFIGEERVTLDILFVTAVATLAQKVVEGLISQDNIVRAETRAAFNPFQILLEMKLLDAAAREAMARAA